MGTVYLVRHGQASFGADDYDVLSPLGHRQCRRLGEYLRGRGLRFDAVLTGTLRRHRESLASICTGLQWQPGTDQESQWLGLNEYDPQALVQAVQPGVRARSAAPDRYREHIRLLREGLARWIEGNTRPEGMPSFAEFSAGVMAALDHVRATHEGDVLVVSSGAPIAAAVGRLLGAADDAIVELNMRLRNSAVTELAYNPKRHALVSFNSVAHLDGPEHADWVTYT